MMKRILFVIGIIAVMLSVGLLSGCQRTPIGEGTGETRDFNNTGFTDIKINGCFNIDISYAESFSITVRGLERDMKRLEVEQTGDTLELRLKGWTWGWPWWGDNTPRAVITLPDLRRLDVGGASDGDVSGFKSGNDFTLRLSGASKINIDMETGDFKAEVSGASDLDINMKTSSFRAEISGASNIKGDIDTEETDIELSGASDIRLTGSGGDLNLDASGASGVKLTGYPVINADVNLSGASDADIDVSGSLDVTVSGASNLNYYGNPDLGRTDITGSSDLNHKTRN